MNEIYLIIILAIISTILVPILHWLIDEWKHKTTDVVNKYKIDAGGDDRRILRFALFHGYLYDQGLGAASLVASSNSISALMALFQVTHCDEFYKWQIIDTRTFKITDSGMGDEILVKDGVEQ